MVLVAAGRMGGEGWVHFSHWQTVVLTARQAVAASRHQPCVLPCGSSVAADPREEEEQQARGGGTAEALLNVARQVVPENIVGAAADMNVLGIITFSLMFGLALSSLGGWRCRRCSTGCCIWGCLVLHFCAGQHRCQDPLTVLLLNRLPNRLPFPPANRSLQAPPPTA